MAECTVEGCESPHDSKGFCKRHYYYWSRYGDPLHRTSRSEHQAPRKQRPTGVEASFLAQVRKTNTCWLWRGPYIREGYGVFIHPVTETVHLAHVASYSLFTGPTAGLPIRHRCSNKRCVSPDHLEVGT
jgi:hypothetical protein